MVCFPRFLVSHMSIFTTHTVNEETSHHFPTLHLYTLTEIHSLLTCPFCFTEPAQFVNIGDYIFEDKNAHTDM